LIDRSATSSTDNNNSFGKEYKLCSKRVIDELFEGTEAVKQYPLRLLYKKNPIHSSNEKSFQIVISVPKRKIRKANKRNRIKRILREIIRLNKHELEKELINHDLKLALFLIYNESTELDYPLLDKKVKKLFQQLNNILSHD
jgi:ribonuclease P protein component